MIIALPFLIIFGAVLMIGTLFGSIISGDPEGDFNIKKQWQLHKEYRAYKRELNQEWKARKAAMKAKKAAAKKAAKV